MIFGARKPAYTIAPTPPPYAYSQLWLGTLELLEYYEDSDKSWLLYNAGYAFAADEEDE